MSYSSSLLNSRSRVLLLLAGLLLSSSVLAGPVQISEASWDAKRHNDALYIRGTGENRAVVTLSDADSGESIAEVRADRRGRWSYEVTSPANIPCTVRADSQDEFYERDVSNRGAFPGGCGAGAANTPPTASITAPANNANFNQGDLVSFTGTASDSEDGDLTGSLNWTSSIDGTIGTGGSPGKVLSVGSHTITASVTDSSAAPGSDSINITVNNVAPQVQITSPADSATYNQGDPVSFTGTASDPGDGDLTASLNWTSSIDGTIGPGGGSFNTSGLSVGSHTITASVNDSNGAPGSASIGITITIAANESPQVQITSPADSATYNQGDLVSFTGTASDSEDGDLTGSLNWTSSIDGTIGTGGSPSKVLSVGSHTITASVTDSSAAPGSDSIGITIAANTDNKPPQVTISSPGNGAGFTQGASVNFIGSASDPEDGDLTAALTWSSSLDGAIGEGGVFSTTSLSIGIHTITANVTDGDSATASATRSIAIQSSGGVDLGGPPKNAFNIMMNYELGMHCTGFEFSYCCVLPPYNSILAQVVKTEKGAGSNGGYPQMLEADPNIVDNLGRPYVVRDPALDSSGEFKKYVLRYWHDAQPRDAGEAGAEQSSTLISQVEGNSLMMWNTVFDAAVTDGGTLSYSTGEYDPVLEQDDLVDGSIGVLQGDRDTDDSNDNYWNAVWNHLYIYVPEGSKIPNLEGEGGHPGGNAPEADKVRLGIDVIYPESTGAALHPMGPIDADNDGSTYGPGDGDNSPGPYANVLTYSTDSGTVVYTQMKVLEDLPVTLTSPRIWEALGLPLTPFEDTIEFFADPGAVDETSLRPYVAMKAQMHYYDEDATNGIGAPVLDGGQPVIGMGTAPIDIPNCERCHALGDGASINSAQNDNEYVDSLVQAEIEFWNAENDIGAGDSDWYSRLKGAAISMLALHDQQHGTSFTLNYHPDENTDGNAATRLGHETVICQRCHADNVIAVVKSANCGPGQNCKADDPRNELWSNITGTTLIPPLTEAIHLNHQDSEFDDDMGRDGSCQGCHPAHRSDGDMSNYPITELGLNAFAGSDNRDAAGGCYVGRDVHSNPFRNLEVGTPSHMNPVGQWLVDNVVSDSGSDKGIWCTNCHTQLSQELWKAENVESLVHAQPGDPGHVREPSADATLADVAYGLGITPIQAELWLDPQTTEDMAAVWQSDPGMCNHAASLLGLADASPFQDGNVATIEINLDSPENCSAGTVGVPGPDCGTNPGNPSFWICITQDVDGDVNVNLLDFCTTPDCVAAAQATLTGPGQAAVPVPFSAATDGRDHWLSAGEPHCADCHAAPFVEQSGNINAFAPFNYPRKASLFRYSRGHQDITCQGCHESTHGMYPVTPPGYVAGSTKAVDQTTWDQAAGMNTDGSHGPLKCGACHQSNDNGVWSRADRISYDGVPIKDDFDAAVSWMHTFTDEADPRQEFCRNCHGNRTSEMREDDGRWKDSWMTHAMRGRVSRTTMDKVEIAQFGHVAGDPAFENPRTTACRGCHDDEWSGVSCTGGESTEWKRHLTQGRVSPAVWESVSVTRTGGTCGW